MPKYAVLIGYVPLRAGPRVVIRTLFENFLIVKVNYDHIQYSLIPQCYAKWTLP